MICRSNLVEKKSFFLEIHDTPKSQPRHRHGRWGNYDPAKDKKNWVKWLIKDQLPEEAPFAGPVSLEFHFHMPIPKSTPKKRMTKLLSNPTPHIKKPDLDNMEKFYKDAMKDMVYNDDSQVFFVLKEKFYGEIPKVIIRVTFFEEL